MFYFSEKGYHKDFILPSPSVSLEIWKILDREISTRNDNQKATFLVSWGEKHVFNQNEVNTLKHIANELIRTKEDIQKEEDFIEISLPHHPVPDNMEKLTMTDEQLNSAVAFLHYGKLDIKNKTDGKCYNLNDRLPLDHKDIYNFSHFERELMEYDIDLVTSALNDKMKTDKFFVLTPDLVNDDTILEDYCDKIGINEDCEIVHVIVNVSIAKETINIGGETGHWAYCAILGENKIVYGDPMGNDHLPTDLMKHLNPIYR